MANTISMFPGGSKEFAFAEITQSVNEHSDYDRTLTLNCAFDPLFVVAQGPNWWGSDYGNGSRYRLSVDDAWSVRVGNINITISGRTVQATGFRHDIGGPATARLMACGIAD